MDRNTLLWTLVVFFGASIAFSGIRTATEGESVLLTLGLSIAALLVMVGVITVIVRRRGGG